MLVPLLLQKRPHQVRLATAPLAYLSVHIVASQEAVFWHKHPLLAGFPQTAARNSESAHAAHQLDS